jgi:hypothetical protein
MKTLNQRTTLSLRSSENPTNSRSIVLKPRFGANPTALGRAAASRDADRRAMALIPRRLGKDEREALLLLADAGNGCTQSILMAHGFAIVVLHDLVRDGLATATRESAITARRGIVVTRPRITDAGRRTLTK